MNELKIIFDKLGVNINDVLAAAGTKWNFHKYHPGLVGGHCIGVDPYYLTYQAEQVGYNPQVILAGRRINDNMHKYYAEKIVKRLISKGISRIGKPLEDINTAIENAGRLEVYGLEKNVSVLATISGAAPMIGFLGTVIGMILSIFEIANAGGQIDIKLLADGLYTAMTTTVAGLIVGIVGYIAFNHLVVRTNKVIHQMEANSVEFLDLLNEPI